MNDSAVSLPKSAPLASPHGAEALETWLLLIHQLPADPAYLRVKVLRRLKAIGAVALKNSVYLLPDRESCREDFEWVIREVVDGGGSATLSASHFLEGISDGDLRALFDGDRDREYAELAAQATRAVGQGATRSDLERLSRALAEIRARDHFLASGRSVAERAVAELNAALDPRRPARSQGRAKRPSGAVWVTRRGVYVDRMASAWLIRRFIDARARFRFVPSGRARLAGGELGFDMFTGGFTHEGDRCTFETLVARFGLDEPGLAPIAEIVHDIDLKDSKFGRPETAGVALLLRGIAAANARDEDRITAASRVFENLLEGFRSETILASES